MMLLNNNINTESLFQSYNELETLLTKTQKKHIHYNSIKNFMYHFDILSNYDKQRVAQFLFDYLYLIKEHDFNFDAKSSFAITNDDFTKIANIYSFKYGFCINVKLDFVLYWGLIADGLLLLFGLLAKLYYIPIVTLLLFIYFLYIRIFKERKHLTYGIFY